MSTPPDRSAVKFDLFADAAHKRKIQSLGDPLQLIARHIDFAHLAQTIDTLLPRSDGHKGPSTVSHRGHGAHHRLTKARSCCPQLTSRRHNLSSQHRLGHATETKPSARQPSLIALPT